MAAILSNKLYVDNDQIRDNLFDIEGQSSNRNSAGKKNILINDNSCSKLSITYALSKNSSVCL
jgi:hypothetical protein